MTPKRVLVAGGGISGLAAAFTLQQEAARRRLPISLTVVEAGREPGGHARSVVDDGWVVERGPNGFLSSGEETLALVDELLLSSQLVEANVASKRRYILNHGALRKVPASPPALLTADVIGWRGKLRLLREPWAAKPPADKDESVFEFAERRLGREAAEVLVDTAVAGISAGDSRALSVRSQFPVLKEWETTHGSLLKGVLARQKNGAKRTRLLSVDRGMGAFTSALAERLNGAVRLGTPIDRIEKMDSAWRVHLRERDSVDADHVVFALPSHATAAITAPLNRELSATLQAIPYAPLSVVALGYKRSAISRPLDGYGYLVTRHEDLASLGVLWESSIFPGRSPDNSVLLRVMLGGARRPEIRDFDDASVAALAASEAAKVLGISGAPQRQWVFRWPSAIAQYNIGHDGRTAAIRQLVKSHRGLHVCGTALDGVSFNDAITSARRTARAVLENVVEELQS
jgi:oxygen-dependent protoporphyrinogen oxidase